MLLTEIVTLDELLHAHAASLGRDFTSYRNHTYRVANLCLALAPGDAEQLEKVAIAAGFHDMGIWTAGTFDYLEPSIRLATATLARTGRSAWAPEIRGMIGEHHRISPHRDHPHWLVEPFRKADWVDVSRGLIPYGLPRRVVAEVFAAWPSAGFHRRLAQLSLERLRSHPWSPLPMVRL
jgi:hypothetical protein